MTREKAIERVIELLNIDEEANEAYEIAYEYDIVLTEIWDDEDEEIIGMMVEDETIYF